MKPFFSASSNVPDIENSVCAAQFIFLIKKLKCKIFHLNCLVLTVNVCKVEVMSLLREHVACPDAHYPRNVASCSAVTRKHYCLHIQHVVLIGGAKSGNLSLGLGTLAVL